MLLTEFFTSQSSSQINEGGNVFDGTGPINKEDVPGIVKQIKKMLKGINVFPDIGSAGYKIQSGDMDLMIDAQDLVNKFGSADVKEAKKALQALLSKKKLETKLSGSNVHVKIPLPSGQFGQVDIMVVPDAKYVAPFHQHGLRGNYDDPEFHGKDIFMVIASIAKSMGLKFEPFNGKLVRRDTGDLVARSRDDVARILLNPSATGDDLNNVKTIMAALENDPRKEEKLENVRKDAAKGLLKLPEAVEEEKIKGADGKACWDGYRYNGTKDGKDDCVKVKEGLKMGDYGHEKEKAQNADNAKYDRIRKNLDAVGDKIAATRGGRIDMTGKICRNCHKGAYQETSQFDDMDGVLHCPKCGDETKRWVNRKVKEEFTGYWKGKDKGTPGKKMVGAAESAKPNNKQVQDSSTMPDYEQIKAIGSELWFLVQDAHKNPKYSDERIEKEINHWEQEASKLGYQPITDPDDYPYWDQYWLHVPTKKMYVLKKQELQQDPKFRMVTNSVTEDENPTDKITMDIPLFIRMMEYAREDAKDDMDLHNVSERAIEMMQQHDYLCMDNYDDLVGGQTVDEAEDDIESMITWHTQGLANANYKGPSATHHKKVLRKLYAKRDAEKPVKEDSSDDAADLIDKARAMFPDKNHPVHQEINLLINAINKGGPADYFIKAIQNRINQPMEETAGPGEFIVKITANDGGTKTLKVKASNEQEALRKATIYANKDGWEDFSAQIVR
jgi:hypothetical protein